MIGVGAGSRGEGFLARQPSAVDNAFAVLEKVAELGPEASSRQLLEQLPMSRATIYRIVKHLVERGYLMPTPGGSGFLLGHRVLSLVGSSAPPQEPIVPCLVGCGSPEEPGPCGQPVERHEAVTGQCVG